MQSKNKNSGFTLIELMIVVAIVAILATVSYSSYRNNVVRANRAAAASYLMEVANLQERYLLDNRDYAADMATLGASPPPEVDDNYNVTTVDPDAGDPTAPPAYMLKAVPTGAQLADDTACGTLALDNLGTKYILETTVATGGTRCWR